MPQTLMQVPLQKQMADDYVSYALATVGRSMPNAIDGLKVSQRRLLQTAFSHGLHSSKPYRKLSLLAGVAMGELHPHGEASGAVVNMADAASYMQTLFQVHGNMGGGCQISRQVLSNDNAASARYLEVRLSAFAEAVFDISHDFLPIRDNYDGTRKEVVHYIPALPLALVNGQSGIGTGYATTTFAFRLQAIAKAIALAVQQPDAKIAIASAIGVPDFPAQFAISPDDGLTQLHETGHGSFSGTGKYEFGETVLTDRKRNKHRKTIIVRSLPEGSAEKFCDKVREAVQAEKLQGVAQVNDYSSAKAGLHIEVVLQTDAIAEAVLAGLLRHTNLRASFSANYMLEHNALPKQFTPAELLLLWLEARESCLAKVYQAQLASAEAKAARLCTLLKAIDTIDQVIGIIRTSESKQQAAKSLAELLMVTQEQAEQVLAINLGQLVRTSASELAMQLQEAEAEQAKIAPFTGATAEARQMRLQAIAKRAEELAREFGLERMCPVSAKQNAAQVQVQQPEQQGRKLAFADAPQAVQEAWAEAESLPYAFSLSLFKSWLKKQTVANAKEFAKAWHARKAEHLLWCHAHSPSDAPQVQDADVRKFLPGVTAKDIKALLEAKGTRRFRKQLSALCKKS